MTREERRLWRLECIRSGILLAVVAVVALGLPNWI